LEEIIAEKKIALPVRPQSPLFQYSPYDFSVIVDCEVERIIEWIKGIDSILAKIVSYPNQKILVDFKDYEKTADCPLSEKGKRIKKVVLDNNREFLAPSEEERRKMATEEEKNIPDSKYRYGHSVDRNIVLYWVPLEYLP
jgi:hypothetical protein